MFERKELQDLQDYFLNLDSRGAQGVFFCRINGYSSEIQAFIQKYYEAARTAGVVIEGRIPNPDERNLDYYEEIMGMEFQMSTGFISASLKKWLPRMRDYQRSQMALSIYDTLEDMRREGKNENMLKNVYIKFMCWLYYKFERIVNRLGENNLPKILYEGEVSNYELKLLTILSGAGCDIVLLQYKGDEKYLKLDTTSRFSHAYQGDHLVPFPEDFSLRQLRQQMEQERNIQRLYGPPPGILPCTNAWIEGQVLENIRRSPGSRGKDEKLFYNCFCRIIGVEDKLTYLNEWYQFGQEVKKKGRNLLILEHGILAPSPEEVSRIRRKTYKDEEQMLLDLSVSNIKSGAEPELQKLMHRAFLDVMLEKSPQPEGGSSQADRNLNRLTGQAVYLLCWLQRYQSQLFSHWHMPEIGCVIYLGGCKTEQEAMFLRFLAKLPTDVLILNPDLSTRCCLEDSWLCEVHFTQSLTVDRFPQDSSQVQMGTAAYHAERELDAIMYQDSGIYRNQQYGKASAVTLQTMYEEIGLLWDQELKYRPGFGVTEGVVSLPVIFAKVSGVKNGVSEYWSGIRKLVTESTIVVKKAPYISSTEANPMKSYATEFFKNGKLQRNKIKNHPRYPYGFLREEMQEHILDKLQLLIEQKVIKGTFENGMEYTIISTVLNLNKEILRLIQKFDFTRKNPKFIYINTTEEMISLEDSILVSFLNLVGFDVIFFIPTGYQCIEKYFNRKLMEEHQTGEYMYDLQIPDFGRLPSNPRQSWRDRLFKRGS